MCGPTKLTKVHGTDDGWAGEGGASERGGGGGGDGGGGVAGTMQCGTLLMLTAEAQ